MKSLKIGLFLLSLGLWGCADDIDKFVPDDITDPGDIELVGDIGNFFDAIDEKEFTAEERAAAKDLLFSGMYSASSWRPIASRLRAIARMLLCYSMTLLPFTVDVVYFLATGLKGGVSISRQGGGRMPGCGPFPCRPPCH